MKNFEQYPPLPPQDAFDEIVSVGITASEQARFVEIEIMHTIINSLGDKAEVLRDFFENEYAPQQNEGMDSFLGVDDFIRLHKNSNESDVGNSNYTKKMKLMEAVAMIREAHQTATEDNSIKYYLQSIFLYDTTWSPSERLTFIEATNMFSKGYGIDLNSPSALANALKHYNSMHDNKTWQAELLNIITTTHYAVGNDPEVRGLAAVVISSIDPYTMSPIDIDYIVDNVDRSGSELFELAGVDKVSFARTIKEYIKLLSI